MYKQKHHLDNLYCRFMPWLALYNQRYKCTLYISSCIKLTWQMRLVYWVPLRWSNSMMMSCPRLLSWLRIDELISILVLFCFRERPPDVSKIIKWWRWLWHCERSKISCCIIVFSCWICMRSVSSRRLCWQTQYFPVRCPKLFERGEGWCRGRCKERNWVLVHLQRCAMLSGRRRNRGRSILSARSPCILLHRETIMLLRLEVAPMTLATMLRSTLRLWIVLDHLNSTVKQ